MAYNKNQECSQRAIRRNKRGRPEKKDRSTPPLPAHQDSSTKKPPTKPKNHNKIAKIKETRSRSFLSAMGHSDLEHKLEYSRLEDNAITRLKDYRKDAHGSYRPAQYALLLDDRFLPAHMRYDTFSIYEDGWPY